MKSLLSITAVALALWIAFAVAAEDSPSRSSKKEDAQAQRIAALEARIVELEAKVAKLEKLVDDPRVIRNTEATKRVAKKLEDPLPVNFEQNRLVNVFDYYRNTTGCSFFINWARLEDAGIHQDSTVTMQLNNDVPAGKSLELVLRAVSKKDDGKAAAYIIEDGVIVISTREEFDRVRIKDDEKPRVGGKPAP